MFEQSYYACERHLLRLNLQVKEVLSCAKKHLPVVLQNESHPYLQERDLRDFCRINNIVFQVGDGV